MTDLWHQRDAEESVRRAEAAAKEKLRKENEAKRRAQERAEKEAKVKDAALTRRIAKEFRCTLRHARTLRSEGTCRSDYAERLADVTGGKVTDFLNKDGRKRNADMVKLFMMAKHDGVSFASYARDPLTSSSCDTVRGLLKQNLKRLRPQEDFDTFEAMLDRLEKLGCTLDMGSAKAPWKDYKLWRIESLSTFARHSVEHE